jgi:sugar/nucleoside kinase (ribokinase family)
MTVVVLGDVFVDVVARLPGPLRRGSDTPAPVRVVGGGSAANTAAWLTAAGAPARLVGTVGADLLGHWVSAELSRFGLDLRLRVDPDLPTGTCVVLVDPDGERTMVPSPGASSALVVPDDVLRDAEALHVSGYAIFAERSRDPALATMSAATAAGLPVSVDAASSGPLERFGADRFLGAAAGALLFANREEAELLIGSGPLPVEEAARRLARSCGEAVVKDGPAGAAWSDGVGVVTVPAVEVAGPVDSTGAGDAFAAGVLSTRAGGAPVPDQLRSGAALAALALGRTGGRPPDPQERV